MRIDWKSLKKFIDDTELYSFINYIEQDTSFYVWIFYQGETFSSLLDKGSVNCEDFVENYKPKAVLKNDLSESGIKKSMSVFVDAPMMLHAFYVSFSTSVAQTNDLSGFVTIKLRDEQGSITEDRNQAVSTEIDFCPGKDVCYGLNGGQVWALEPIQYNFTVDCIMAPEIPSIYGGQVYFVRNVLLNPYVDKMNVEAVGIGRVPCSPEGVNVLRVKIKHVRGVETKFQLCIMYYV